MRPVPQSWPEEQHPPRELAQGVKFGAPPHTWAEEVVTISVEVDVTGTGTTVVAVDLGGVVEGG
jgi:hypothetical protein